MVSEFDTIIVGAGPAGNTAAYFLSLAGKRVLVLEKERLPRYKACGGALSPKVLKQFHFSFDPVIEHSVSQVSFAFGNKFATTPIATGDIVMVMRDRFDEHILANSEIEIRDRSWVRTVKETGMQVEVETQSGDRFRGRYLIGADGANSVVARPLDLRRGKVTAAALDAEVTIDPDELPENLRHPVFIFGELEQGYLWIFPKRRCLSVGAAALHPSRGQLQSTLLSVMSGYGISLDRVKLCGHPIPITARRKQIATARCLLVGDAAGLADPFSGEGIRLAITSGRLAAEAILAEKPEQYARQVDKKIRGSHLWAWHLAAFFYRFQGLCFRAGMTNPQAVPAFLELLAGESSYRRVMLKLLASLPMQLARHLLGNPTQVLISARGV